MNDNNHQTLNLRGTDQKKREGEQSEEKKDKNISIVFKKN